ncbi:MAG: flagellar basal body L-ring protein FlgH [Gemmatimonadaceae bacterium]|nr:flagellar basal body L-ring protein FlgH [Gemmatimonadaceae bacterium]
MTISTRDMVRLTALIGLTMLVTQHAHAQAPARRDSVVVAPTAPASALNARPARLNWTSDRRNFVVGDLIIVHIDENTLASANMTDNATQSRKKNTDFGLLTPGAAAAMGASFNTTNNGQSGQRGDRSRQLRLNGDITARVMSIDPVSGVLTIKGTKSIGVDKEQQTINFSGAIRPQDLGGRNTVESSLVADAKLDIVNKGSLGKAKQGMLSKILGAFWP